MSIYELFIIAVGVALDAFAVSICCGIASREHHVRKAFIAGAFFGGFQTLMPLVGWAAGFSLRFILEPFGHWIAFVLLGAVGGKMVYEAINDNDSDDDDKPCQNQYSLYAMLVMALATSIDALGVGASFAFVNAPILLSALLMGIVTFIFSFAGVFIGKFFGHLFERRFEIAGGVVIVLIGWKILIEKLLFS
jgi:putative Mn2+ efflux pump MntP